MEFIYELWWIHPHSLSVQPHEALLLEFSSENGSVIDPSSHRDSSTDYIEVWQDVTCVPRIGEEIQFHLGQNPFMVTRVLWKRTGFDRLKPIAYLFVKEQTLVELGDS